MSARIRLKKVSSTAKKRYNYRFIVISRTQPRDSRAIEELGYYDSAKKPAVLKIKKDRYDYWIKKGAQPTETVASLYKRYVKQTA